MGQIDLSKKPGQSEANLRNEASLYLELKFSGQKSKSADCQSLFKKDNFWQ